MNSLVLRQVIVSRKLHPTHITLVWLLPGVGPQVPLQAAVVEELLSAVLARVPPWLGVHHEVLLQVRLHPELLAGLRALEWLPRVPACLLARGLQVYATSGVQYCAQSKN